MVSPLGPMKCDRCKKEATQLYDGICNNCIEDELNALEADVNG